MIDFTKAFDLVSHPVAILLAKLDANYLTVP